MPAPFVAAAALAGALLPGLPFIRGSSTKSAAPVEAAPPAPVASGDRVEILSADDPSYQSLAIPRSYKTAAAAPLRLLVFRGGAVVRDHGVTDRRDNRESGPAGSPLVEESGTAERAFVASDGSRAVVIMTRYVSRVDLRPNSKSDDPVTGTTTLTSVEPEHPDGGWRLTVEEGRWVRDLVVLPNRMGVVVTTFMPRNGPADVRLLDGSGRETIHVPDSAADALRIEATPDGRYAAVDLAFRHAMSPYERGIMVFDVAHGTQWTYGWRYGADEEPMSWTLESDGSLSVASSQGTRRFDATGRRR